MRSFIIVAAAVLAIIAVLVFTRSEPDAQTLCMDIDLTSTQVPNNDMHDIMHQRRNVYLDLGDDYTVVVSEP